MKELSSDELDFKITKFMDRKLEEFPELRTPKQGGSLTRSWHLVRDKFSSQSFNNLTATWS
jgi:hypothetical protein